ncbi:hypothetical protein M3647_21140 [Paenibacillus cellulositrophicus]|uniref:hypothetical protein n=1 Tax=Paenibacillus cellulositrophicus TaxID=562959 RepID=UPI002040ECA8|nr:hypothetical protein [Paenibacillus cellulositrophicus]MCM2999984.1 hypothetical protein [Paenibacillus cellulositrophicus]
MIISNANKQVACEKHRTLLELIYTFGNKVMLMKQLYEYAQVIGVAKNYSTFCNSVKELINADILRKESFNAFKRKSQLQMLIIRKYGIRFVEGKTDSYSVASVKKAHGNERILISIFKNQYILNKIIPRIQKASMKVTLGAITELLERDQSTVLYNKNQGLSALLKMRNRATLQKHLDMSSIDQDIEKLQKIKRRMEEGLKKGSKASEWKGRGRLRPSEKSSVNRVGNVTGRNRDLSKEEKIDNYTLDTMLAFNAYIAQIRADQSQIKITALVFDIHNRSDIYKIATQIACMFHMFDRYFKDKFELKVGIVSIDEFASNHLKTQAESAAIDFVSKERKGTRLSNLLESWRVKTTMQEQIKVRFVDYNITNEFLDGVKHANLIRR